MARPASADAFSYFPSLLGLYDAYDVNTTSLFELPGQHVERESQTMMLKGAVRADGSGFGWRHTAVRHGWTDKDEAMTRVTLASPFHTITRDVHPTTGTIRDTYSGAEVAGGWYYHRTPTQIFLCRRVVVVNPIRRNDWGSETQPMTGLNATQTGIVTSYGHVVSAATYASAP
jgi:hypothetical protein